MMNVLLPPDLERQIVEKVDSGLYTTASEVVQEALRLLFTRDTLDEEQIALFRSEIQLGLDELDRGEVVPMEDVFAEARQRIATHRRPA
jgi:antitoxin ParD1/3/4